MPHLFIKISKTCLWAIVPFFLISQGNPDQASMVELAHEGYYAFKVTGEVSENLSGIINFVTTKETSVGGSEYYVLRFMLKSKKESPIHNMEFLISKPCTKSKISVGTYEVAKPINGFLNYFEGVFGAADFKRMDELPFFTDRGTIRIRSLDENTVEGSMSVTLHDPNGKKITIQGEFDALRQVP